MSSTSPSAPRSEGGHPVARTAGAARLAAGVAALLAACAAIAAPAVSAEQLLDRVMARVGGEAITLTDLEAAIGLGLLDAGKTGSISRDEALQRLIDRRLELTEADRSRQSEPDPPAVQAELDRMKARAGAALPSLLQSTGVSEDRLVALARETVRIREYLASRFPDVPIGDADAQDFYRAHPDAFRRDGVLMPFEEAAPQARAALAAERRDARIAQWLANLRRGRVEVAIPNVSSPAPPPAAPPAR